MIYFSHQAPLYWLPLDISRFPIRTYIFGMDDVFEVLKSDFSVFSNRLTEHVFQPSQILCSHLSPRTWKVIKGKSYHIESKIQHNGAMVTSSAIDKNSKFRIFFRISLQISNLLSKKCKFRIFFWNKWKFRSLCQWCQYYYNRNVKNDFEI